MKNKILSIITISGIAGLLAGCAGLGSLGSSQGQSPPYVPQPGGSTNVPCPGVYTGYAKYTNTDGTYWVTPPQGATNCIFSDVSGFPAPYASVACVGCNNLKKWCGPTTVTFPVTGTAKYEFIVYVTSATPPPTNGQPISMNIEWQ
jgi:hypothetical protein